MAKLLIVEDDATLGMTLRLALGAQGHEVQVAPTLARARAFLAAQAPDLILLDLGLPDGDGLDLVKDLRKAGVVLPILALTARTTLADRVDGLRHGADDYVTKPFDLPELSARIDALLRRHGWSHPPGDTAPLEHATIGRLVIDFATREASSDGEPVSISDLELRFLRHLLERAPRVVSREELLTEVWNLPAASRTRSIDTFVYRLRRLIEDDPTRPQILRSVRGAGWRLCPDPAA
ncbi:MAG: response regulator transcription factor [Deltaproteobacteria bacterium]|nr:response regulator transcription factor [Deltaproteobacteria bacterium]